MPAHNRGMAAESKLTIRVSTSRGATTVRYSTTGRYIRLLTNGINGVLTNQPTQPNGTSEEFWAAVLPLVTAAITEPG
jgi:hypothetical protein